MKKKIVWLSIVFLALGVLALYALRPPVRHYRGGYRNYTVQMEEKKGYFGTEHFVILFPLNAAAPTQGTVSACFKDDECVSLVVDKPYAYSSMIAEQNPRLLKAARFAEEAKFMVQRDQYLVTR